MRFFPSKLRGGSVNSPSVLGFHETLKIENGSLLRSPKSCGYPQLLSMLFSITVQLLGIGSSAAVRCHHGKGKSSINGEILLGKSSNYSCEFI